MQSSRATKTDECKVAGIVAALDRDDTQRALHGGARHRDDAPRQVEWRPESWGRAGLAAQKLDKTRPGRFEVEAECSAQEVLRIEPAEDQVSVCHRRLRASATVADGSRCRARAFRTHAQRAARIHPGDRPPARAHGMNVEHGDGDGQAAQRGLAGRARGAHEEAGVGRGAAHVEADGALDPQLVRHPPRRHNTTSGTRENRAHRLAGGPRRSRDPAARLHDEDAPAAVGARDVGLGAQRRALEASQIRP